MLKRNILQVVLVLALSAFGQSSAGTVVSSDTELGSSNENLGNKSVLANSNNRALKGRNGRGGSKGSKGNKGNKGKGKVS
jgi:hypothetical protein